MVVVVVQLVVVQVLLQIGVQLVMVHQVILLVQQALGLIILVKLLRVLEHAKRLYRYVGNVRLVERVRGDIHIWRYSTWSNNT